MEHITPMNSKETKRLLEELNEMFDTQLSPQTFPYFLLKSSSGRVYTIVKSFADITTERLRMNTAGLYFCDVESGIRLSIEGSQFMGRYAKRGVLELDKEQIKGWLQGHDIVLENAEYQKEEYQKENGTYLIKYNDEFYGCGILRSNKLLNFVPKMRRLGNVEQV